MPPPNINVSMECFNELANALEAQGQKVNPENPITVTKDIKIKGPIDYRQVTIRKDVLVEVSKVYKTPVDEREMEVSDSTHFINFLDDVYKYIFKGEKPKTQETKTTTVEPKKSGWNQ